MFDESVVLFFLAATLVLGCFNLADILGVLVVAWGRDVLLFAVFLDFLGRGDFGAL